MLWKSSVLTTLMSASVATVTLLPSPMLSQTATGYYHSEGTQIIDPEGNVYEPRGIVTSSWLTWDADILSLKKYHDRDLNSESGIYSNFLRLLNITDDGNLNEVDAFRQSFRENFLNYDDFQMLGNEGFNSIRIPFNYRMISDEDRPGEINEEWFSFIDQSIGWARDAGMSIMLVMNAAPGGQSHQPHADPEYSYWYEDENENENEIWRERGVSVLWESNDDYTAETGRDREFNRQRFAEIWRTIAERYQNEQQILGYELMNEPFYYYTDEMNDDYFRSTMEQIAATIREVDQNHLILVTGNNFSELTAGLMPPFDSNMAVGFRRFWRETGYEDGRIQEYLDLRNDFQIPFVMVETGKNSNPWLYETKSLMESINIGWYIGEWKKTPSMSQSHMISISDDYEYLLENWRENDDVDTERIQRGMLDLIENVRTENCEYIPGLFEALLDPEFNSVARPFHAENIPQIPGVIPAVWYDVGNQGVAYYDNVYKITEYLGEPNNIGEIYRNDGVDIRTMDVENQFNMAYHVTQAESNEWLRYTVDVTNSGCYSVSYYVFSDGDGQVQLEADTATIVTEIPSSNGEWISVSGDRTIFLEAGLQSLRLDIIETIGDIAWINFESDACPEDSDGPDEIDDSGAGEFGSSDGDSPVTENGTELDAPASEDVSESDTPASESDSPVTEDRSQTDVEDDSAGSKFTLPVRNFAVAAGLGGLMAAIV